MGGPRPRIWTTAFTLAALFHAAAAAFLFRQDSESRTLPTPSARELALTRLGTAASPNPNSHSAEVLDARIIDPSDPDTGPAPLEAAPVPPEPTAPLDVAEVAGIFESATEAPVGEAPLVPPTPLKTATASPDPPVRNTAPEPAVMVAPIDTASAPPPAPPVPVETLDTGEEASQNVNTPPLATAVSNVAEADAAPAPQEAAPIPPDPAVPLDLAEVAGVLESAAEAPVGETALVPPAPAEAATAPPDSPARDTLPEPAAIIAPIDTDSAPTPAPSVPVEEADTVPAVLATLANGLPEPAPPARDTVPEPAVLVAARSTAHAHDVAQPLAAELVGAIEEAVARVSNPPVSESLSQHSDPETTRGKQGPGDEIAEGLHPADGVDSTGVQAAYLVRIQAWLARHKKYPRGARTRGHTGTALLYFAIDRNGRVRNHELRKSTGHALLDREVRAMIERAQPLPRIPEQIRQEPLELLVPVEFVLQ